MDYKNPAATVDIIAFSAKEGIVLIKRKHEPYKGKWALPGGHLNNGEEDLEQACVRELREETGLIAEVDDLKLIGVYSEPNRDPRGHVISHVYSVSRVKGEMRADDDAEDVGLFGLDSLPELAFDHKKIIGDWRCRR